MRMDQHIKQLIEKYTFEAARLSHYEALERYNMAYAQAKELGNAFTIRACAANLGAMYVSLGKKAEAEKGLKYLKEATPPEGMADCVSKGDLFFNFGLAYKVLGRFREAGSSFKQALEEYEEERDNLNMKIETLKQLIQISEDGKKYGEKVDWCHRLEETYKHAKRFKEQLQVMIQRITLQHQLPGQKDELQQQDIDRELDKCCDLFNSLRQEEVKGQVMAEVGMLVQMSVLLTKFKHREKARKYLEEALSLFEAEDEQSLEQAVVLQNLGAICNYLEDWKTAQPYHQRAAAIYQHYANLPPDPKTPMAPQAAKRCLGHCLANHGYALVHLEDVDEARVVFQKAMEQAEYSGDCDTKWQMAEALGDIHFQIAFHDIDSLNKEARIQLPASRLEHLKKSMMWYKTALTLLSSPSGGTEEEYDRVLDKYTRVQMMRQKTSQGLVATFIQLDPQPTQADNATDSSDGESSESQGEEEVDGGSSGYEQGGVEGGTRGRQGEDGRETGKKTDEEYMSDPEEDSKGEAAEQEGAHIPQSSLRPFPRKPSLQHIRMEKTMRTPPAAEDDDDEIQVKEEYWKQLGTDTLESAGEKQTVLVDVHAQHTQHHSSSAESGSSDSDEDDEDSSSTEEEEDEHRRQLPPVPSQSPPRTPQASGTYVTPQQNEEMNINQLYGSSKSRPRSPTNGMLSVHFDPKNQSRSGELASSSKRQTSLNYFISSDEEHEEATKQRKPAAPDADHNDPDDSDSDDSDSDSDDESLGTGQDSPGRPSTSHSSKQDPKQVGFQMGGDEVPHGQNKGGSKDSKICSIM